MFDSSEILIDNKLNTYKMFYRGTENKTFGIEFMVAFDDNAPDYINLFNIKSLGLINILNLYKQGDTIYMSINGINSINSQAITYTTKKQINSLDNKIHVFALYSNKSISVYINGLSDETVNLVGKFVFEELTAEDVYCIVGPASTGKSFTISDLAVYDKRLTSDEIRFHMSWANKDNSPVEYAKQINTYSFDMLENDRMFSVKKNFIVKSDYDAGAYSGLYVYNNGLTVTQTDSPTVVTGTWYYNQLISSYDNFVGIDISWDTASPEYEVSGSNYVKVSASYDGGSTFYVVQNNRVVPNFLATALDLASSNLLIKVEIHSIDSSLAIQPRIDNFSIKIYKNLDFVADAGGFYITPLSGTYSVSNNKEGILLRSKNLGLSFVSQTASSNPGVAKIQSISNSAYRTVEFWFKTNNTAGAVYDSNAANAGNPHLYLQGGQLYKNLPTGSKVYINGIDVTSSNYTIMTNQAYHCVITYSTDRTSPIYINGSNDGSKTPSNASYGYITLYPTEQTSSQISNRYLTYLTLMVGTVNDGVTSFGSIVELGSATTSINGGLSVVARPHIY
jgi:hypothetical protein